MKLNLILEVKSQEMDKIFSESELLEFLKERLTIGKIDNIKILSAGVINAITVGECDFPNHFIKCLHENGIYYIYYSGIGYPKGPNSSQGVGLTYGPSVKNIHGYDA